MSDGLELRWPGKYDAQGRRTPVPRPGAQLQRWVAYKPEPTPADERPDPWRNRLVEGDNLQALDALVREHAGTVDLVYIDPPFATGGRFEVVTPVGPRTADGPQRSLRQPAYTDAWPGGAAGLVAMLDPRLRLVHELLAPHGSLYVHVDPTVGHAVKLLLDEVFGAGCFQREIVWRIGWVSGFKSKARNWIRNHDLLFFYVKDPKRFTFNKRYVPHPPGYLRRDGSPPRGRGVPLCDVWNAGDAELQLRGRESLDSIQIKSFSTEKTGYATQKNESLLRRIVETSSNPGDLVADVFCGSGTTLAVAEALGRRWIGCDTGRAAIHITTGRLLATTRAQGFEVLAVAPDRARMAAREGTRAQAQVERARAQVRAGWKALTGEELEALRVRPEGEPCAGGHALPDRDGSRTRSQEPAEVLAAWRWSVPVAVEPEGDAIGVGETWPAERASKRSRTKSRGLATERGLSSTKSRGPATQRGRSRTKGLVTELVLPRASLGSASEGPPPTVIAERARLRVRLHGLATGEVAVELVSLHYPTVALLPEVLREPEPGPLELVERWSVTWDDDVAGPVDVVLGRFDRERTLPTLSPAHDYGTHVPHGAAATLVVRVEDALHREHRLRCRLARSRPASAPESAVGSMAKSVVGSMAKSVVGAVAESVVGSVPGSVSGWTVIEAWAEAGG